MKRFFWVLVLLVAGIQIIRPSRNDSKQMSAQDITLHEPLPRPVLAILERSCYDCHSNHTDYPWYFQIQPVAWFMQNHVDGGKRKLNFSEFGTYSPKKQNQILKETIGQIKQGDMPLDSYLWIHRNARLSATDKSMINAWADSLRRSIQEKYHLSDEPDRKEE